MFIHLEQKKSYVVIKLKGRIDAFNFELVESKLKTLQKSGKKNIAIDLTQVEFINLQATLTIENLARDLKEVAGQIYIIGNNQRTSLLKKTFSQEVIFADSEDNLLQLIEQNKDLNV